MIKFALLLITGGLLAGGAVGQTVYVDVLTASTMRIYANQIEDQLEETNDNLNAIQKTELLITTQLETANNLQKKVVKGLTEVSRTVKNLITVKRITEVSLDIVAEVGEAIELAAENPEYAIFAGKSASVFRTRALDLASDVTDVLAEGETNMMDAGERQKLLNHIYDEIRLLYGAAFGVTHSIRWAMRRGFWKSLFPFSGWVNQDVRIMNEIIANAKML
ncbi:MAG: hypothetical protein AB2L20_07515 [Mangrovibacterium sp.]